MDTKEIQICLKKINPAMQFNVFPANRIPVRVSLPFFLVSNLDPDTKPGSHWVAIHIDKNGMGEYFDSFGRKPTKHLEAFLNVNTKKWFYNNEVIQNYFSSLCGMYCLIFLYLRNKGIRMSNFVEMFSKDTVTNDVMIYYYFKTFFK